MKNVTKVSNRYAAARRVQGAPRASSQDQLTEPSAASPGSIAASSVRPRRSRAIACARPAIRRAPRPSAGGSPGSSVLTRYEDRFGPQTQLETQGHSSGSAAMRAGRPSSSTWQAPRSRQFGFGLGVAGACGLRRLLLAPRSELVAVGQDQLEIDGLCIARRVDALPAGGRPRRLRTPLTTWIRASTSRKATQCPDPESLPRPARRQVHRVTCTCAHTRREMSGCRQSRRCAGPAHPRRALAAHAWVRVRGPSASSPVIS